LHLKGILQSSDNELLFKLIPVLYFGNSRIKITDIAFFEPYYSGSHKYFADGFAKAFPEQIQLFTLQGCHWKWRMHGSSVTFADMLEKSGEKFDTIIVSSLADTDIEGIPKYAPSRAAATVPE